LVLLAITRRIPFELAFPKVDVRGWHRAVLWAHVPEAAVDKNGDLPARQRYVGPNDFAGGTDCEIDAKSEALSVQRRP